MKWIWQRPEWPNFNWNSETLLTLVGKARFEQGKLLAHVKELGFDLNQEAHQNPSKGRSTSYDLNWNDLSL